MSDTIVSLDKITKRYGSVTAVEDLSLDIREGEFFSLLGPSGCGKTTTLRMIAGFEQPTEGTVSIRGRNMNDVSPDKRDTGMVFQGYALFPHKTVAENVGFGLKMEGISEDERAQKVSETLELVDLPGFEDRSPTELSGGQQQRVALARALAIEPEVLLLDEPLSNLDYKLRKELRFELKRIQSELGVTTVYVTHDQEEALSMSDRILVMNGGYQEQIGSPKEIYNTPNNEFVAGFIGEANLFEGDVRSVDGDVVEVGLTGEAERRVTVPRGDNGDVEPGSSVLLNARPEHVRLANGSDDAIVGTIESKTYLGKSTRLLVDAGDRELQVEVPAAGSDDDEYRIGDEIRLDWDEDSLILIPDDTDR